MSQSQIESYQIHNSQGMSAEILNFGARVRKINLPSSLGGLNVALGYSSLEMYKADPYFLGATVGRYANRIAGGKFELDGQTVELPKNNDTNHLHGGPVGFAMRYWQLVSHREDSLVLSLRSEDGDQGYPGTLDVEAEYRLFDNATLMVEYRATTNKPTPVNLASHTYFNLNGATDKGTVSSKIIDHMISLNSAEYTPVNGHMIPLGAKVSVQGTALDLRNSVQINERIDFEDPQIQLAKGFDHNFIIQAHEPGLACVGRVSSETSGVQMIVYSDQPGVQFYTGNFLAEPFAEHQAFCLETQNFPDAPNQPGFPNSILRPGESYRAQTRFEFDRIT